MQDEVLSIKLLLETLFKTLKKSTNYFAYTYLLKDVSLISKWKTGKAVPKNEDIDKIVEFVNNESTGMQRHLIRVKIEEYINDSLLDLSLKKMLLGIEDFSTFLTETLLISVSDVGKNLDLNISQSNFPANYENNYENNYGNNERNENSTETIEIEDTKIAEIPTISHVVPQKIKPFSMLVHKYRTILILLLIIVLCSAVFIFKQIISNNEENSIKYTSNYSIPNEKNTIILSEEYFLSYTYLKDSEDGVQLDINGTPIPYYNFYPKVINNVIYLPFSDTFKQLGFSLINYNEKFRSFKDLRTGKTVMAEVGRKNFQYDNKDIELTEPIIMEELNIYIPAYCLMGFTSYLDRMIPYNIDIMVDSKIQPKYEFEPRVINDTLYLSFRYLFELFDYNVKPDRRINDGINRAIAVDGKQTVTVEESKEIVVLNDKPVNLSAAVLMLADTTYVPVDIIKQVLNMDYNWDRDNKILEITTSKRN
ncbi:copper amine oxidase N-terminal domain-containing protein [Ruminiclostridium herbifermentans]|uniref:Copper amine oxidase N-terminal domain-containing protein n=1 Tax=Ruminiclostridium herbifermentans TaxID=2488810 RepID=A0A4U7JJY2_9FIRM|nr:copper amine oxidase N-terminal domain-containing protein [Ruminiclostridium herbifermentans]QNU67599.1 copper amine oxidase N-terminal domain-containing protein [Ruminiclostridium herbifermentans]